VLVRLPGLSPMVEALHRAFGRAEIRDLPWEFAERAPRFAPAAAFARAIDIRDFAFDPDFLSLPMFDYFARALGLDPAAVPPAERRNAWLARRLAAAPTPWGPERILVCPRSAMALRSMPEAVHAALLEDLLRFGPVATQGAIPPHLVGRVARAPEAASLGDLCALVAGAAWVVSTDTGMVHLADALERPCLAFFPTHDPVLRVRDYPLCRPVRLDAGLPPGEFARDARDVAQAHAAWTRPGWRDRLRALLDEASPHPALHPPP
jgi:hypothetical protein